MEEWGFFRQGFLSTNFQLIDVFLDVASIYILQSWLFLKPLFCILILHSPGHRTQIFFFVILLLVQFTYYFQGNGKELKTCAIEQILLNNNKLKVNDEYTKSRCEISPRLTTKTASLTGLLSYFLYIILLLHKMDDTLKSSEEIWQSKSERWHFIKFCYQPRKTRW